MYIHNLYNDLMLSTTILLDHVIFNSSDVIKKYEFNLGNRSFQLPKDLKANIDLPVAIVTINDESASFGQRTETLKQLINPNVNHIKVLYNKTKKSFLYLHEESTQIPISITINTESQLQAKEISHVIRRYLPMNKYIEQHSFSSFLEISNQFLGSLYFDPYSDEIINLFSKFNKLLGITDFYFSVNYRPILRLDSISAAAPDSTQRTFQVTVDLTYMMQWPMFLFYEPLKLVERINLNINTPEFNNPISSIKPVTLFDHKKQIKNYMMHENNILNMTDNEFVYFNYVFEKRFHNVSDKNTEYNLVSTKNNKFLFNILPHSFIDEDNTITFKISREDYEKHFTPSIINPILLQIINNDI